MLLVKNGFEIEKRWLVVDRHLDYSKLGIGFELYDEVLSKGRVIEQGYIKQLKDKQSVIDLLELENLSISENKVELPNMLMRVRRIDNQEYELTLKNTAPVKQREIEFKLTPGEFKELWRLTKGARVYKKRADIKRDKFMVTYDAFIDRLLLIAEIEVGRVSNLKLLPKIGLDVTGKEEWSNKNLAK
jgi:CYTH domain-containing protein